MSLPTYEELRTLLTSRRKLCVSIYLPTRRTGEETHKDRIRLKNLTGQAEERLIRNGLRAPQVKHLLQPIENLRRNEMVWQERNDGLAIFLSSEMFRHYSLPSRFKELVVVGERFYLKPLLPLLSGDGSFFILALSQNQVRLLKAMRYSIQQVDLNGFSESIDQAFPSQNREGRMQPEPPTRPPFGRGMQEAALHRRNVLRYCHMVNRGVYGMLKDERAPLVLAAVDSVQVLYREANTYPHLMQLGIEGNPEPLSPEDLHVQAWEIVAPVFEKAQIDAVARYYELSNTPQTSCDVREIVPAAHHGRVDVLLVAADEQQWGRFDPDTNSVRLEENLQSGDEDLLDLAAIETLLRGGSVFAVSREKMPDQAKLCAVFRY